MAAYDPLRTLGERLVYAKGGENRRALCDCSRGDLVKRSASHILLDRQSDVCSPFGEGAGRRGDARDWSAAGYVHSFVLHALGSTHPDVVACGDGRDGCCHLLHGW